MLCTPGDTVIKKKKGLLKMKKILVLEDESNIRSFVVINLRRSGYEPIEAENGTEALEKIKVNPDICLALLDVMLPDIDGFEVCRRIRASNARIGIIMLTAKCEERDVVRGLELGADDYIVKPFSRHVLLARIQAVLRRPEAIRPERTEHDGLSFDVAAHEVSLVGRPLDLTGSEYRVLALLLSRPGRVYTRSQIIDLTQSPEKAVTDRAIDVQIVGLRRKLGAWAAHIETIRGVGYRFRP